MEEKPLTESEIEQRREAALKKMLKTPPKPHTPNVKKGASPDKDKAKSPSSASKRLVR